MANSTPTPEKVPNKRYTDVSGLKAGDTADKTVYADKSGAVSDKEPQEGRIFVAQGDVVSQAMIDALNAEVDAAQQK